MDHDPEAAAIAGFRAAYGHAPGVVVRAPGRVNLIGEHTDYNHLPVLPFAIEQAVYVAASPAGDPSVECCSATFAGTAQLPRLQARARSGWGRYVAGALNELEDVAPERGARVFIASSLPAEGGLSSSSALTMGLLAALDAAWETGLGCDALERRGAAAERRVGVESGGMDQAVIVSGRAGHALRIDFEPPARRLVPLPEGLAFVVASSGEPAAKGDAARDAYNERVVGTRLAAALLADQIGLDTGNPPRLRDVSDDDVAELLADDLPERVTPLEVAHGAGAKVEILVNLTAGRWDARAKVPVRRYARHVLSEAQRVDAVEAALASGDLEALGRLLDASHASLRDDYGCSTPALDRLCAAMREAGALGARLTGAGFGGFAVAAVRPEQRDAVIEAAIASTGGPAFAVRAADGLARR